MKLTRHCVSFIFLVLINANCDTDLYKLKMIRKFAAQLYSGGIIMRLKIKD